SGGGRKPVYSSKLTHLKITHYQLSRLRQLDLSCCEITDIIIEEIARSSLNLKYLNLRRCYKISKEAVDQVVSLNPKINIVNFVDTIIPPDFISAFSDFLGQHANNQNSVLSQIYWQPNSTL
ncbi:350_t:CDS:1, partial [Funneliformis geosporum]